MTAPRSNPRGMGMRDMKARQMGRTPRLDPGKTVRSRQLGGPEGSEGRDGSDGNTDGNTSDEVHETIDDGTLVDQGDGVRVVHKDRRRADRDDEAADLDFPDEPPPGWCET
jgi:hypothetical protein